MTDEQITAKNIRLAFDVIRRIVADPALMDEAERLADDGTLVLYDESDSELTAANDRIAAAYEQRGEPVVRVAVQRHVSLAPR